MFRMTGKAWTLCVAGIVVGAGIGYFYRPPAVFIGQLPFDVVITRGGNLKGIDQIYLEVAKTSFNYLLFGGIAGGLAGAVAGMFLSGKSKDRTE